VVLDDADWGRLQQAMRRREPFREMLVHYRSTDGHRLTERASGDLLRDAQGRAVGWSGVSRNVTAEERAQAELARSKALLERLFRESPDAVVVASIDDGRILLLNDSFSRITGYTEEEARGHSALQLGLWRDKRTAIALREALGGGGRVHDLRSTVWTRDGRRHEMLLTAGRFEWDGEPVSVITARDVTGAERERAQTAAILDNASVGIALVRERRFERVNPQFERMFGQPGGSLQGQPIGLLLSDTDGGQRLLALAEQALASGETLDIERHMARPDGSRLVARLRARAVDAGRPDEAGSIWVAEDITERRRAEQELAEARNAAEAASQAKSAFLASMSHEIRTPLNGVLGLARLLQDPALDAARRAEYLGHLVESAEGLAGLVSDVLDLSKIEAGQLQLEQLPFDLPALADSSFRSFATLGRERGLQMRCEIDPGLPRHVQGDPVRLRQILSNYLSNALKFTAAGRITLKLSQPAPQRLRAEVIDSGIGIADEARERLFLPFEQADSSTTRRFGGTGLGLSICRQLAQLMGGEVGVTSQPGVGSRFWLELPLQPVAAPAPVAVAAAPAKALEGMKVLVVEDNQVNMLIITALLRALGAEPVEAQDGAEALVIARDMANELDAVLMDLHMPVLDGVGAARALAADERTARLPVIALSAAVLASEREQALAAGMVDFVAKPVHEAELKRALARVRATSDVR
jgi:PAS domain S-box-containing protein